jgi:hypothetical protein
MASKRDRAARIAALEERLADLESAAGTTWADPFAEHGFTEAEMERAGEWLLLCRRLETEDREAEGDADEEQQRRQRIADEEAARVGAGWLGCRLQHGPGLCEVDCAGEHRHRKARKPAPSGTSPDDLRFAALVAEAAQRIVPEVTGPAVAREADRWAERRAAVAGADEMAVLGVLPWRASGAPARKAR